MIPRFVVYFGTLDITPHALVSIEYATRHIYNKLKAFVDDPTERTWYRFYCQVERYLTRCWIAKLKWLLDNVKGKEVVLIARGQRPVTLTDPLSVAFGDVTNDTEEVCPEVQAFLMGLWYDVVPRVEGAILDAFHADADGMIPHHRRSIDKFKQWLAKEEEEMFNERSVQLGRVHGQSS